MIKTLLSALALCFTFPSVAADDIKQVEVEVGSWGEVVFRSDPLLNLHLFLYEMARDENALKEFRSGGSINSEDLPYFEKAIEEYRELGAERNIHIIRSDSEVAELTGVLLNRQNIDIEISQDSLYRHVVNVAPIYKRNLWEMHSAKNLEWLRGLQVKLDKYGGEISQELEKLFSEKLVDGVHTVNITYKPGLRQGATTSGRSFQTIINSSYPDYSGWFALEMFFHELSHVNSVSRKSRLQKLIVSEFDKYSLEQHKKIWHPIHFYTVGEVVKRAISKEEPKFIAYAKANGLYVGHWDYKVILDRYWMPYLDGLVSMEQAIENIAKELSKKG